MQLGNITNILTKLKIKIPEIYLKEEVNRFITEGTTERIVEIPLILREIPTIKSNILDIGCRYSLLSIQLASLGHNVYGIDIHNYYKKHTNFHFIKDSILTYKFKNNFFDLVISMSTIEHIGLSFYDNYKNIEADKYAVDNIYKCLRINGIFLITVPFGKQLDNKWYRVYNLERIYNLLGKYKILKMYAYSEKNGQWFPNKINIAKNMDSSKNVRSVIFIKSLKPR